jgi:mannitol-1-phosphate 5-dehydrogenase
MSTFVGIGLGPIQTGIFLAGASKGGFDRIVIAEVNDQLKDAVNAVHSVTINIAAQDKVYQETYSNVQVDNPMNPEERAKLVQAAAEASELATALPSVKFFGPSAEWMREGFALQPERRRFIYTAENNNHAAEYMQEALGVKYPNTWCLNTVIGKMSGVQPAEMLTPLAPGAAVGHLVEEFNTIYISKCEGIENRKVQSLYVKDDLYPFEEAKLYGHNAVHFLLATLGKEKGCSFMNEIAAYPELIEKARAAFINESGAALIKKYASLNDELFTANGFADYANGLLVRMTNPFLQDAVARITRDLERKLSWDDRVIGTMRVVMSQGYTPANFADGAKLAAAEFAEGADVRAKLAELWPKPWSDEHEALCKLIGC